MGEPSKRNRVEIELTSNDGAAWARPESPVDDDDRERSVDHSEAVMSHGSGQEKTRIWGTALAVVAALALGWVLGRSGGTGSDAASDVSVSTSTSVAPNRSVAEPIAGVDPAGNDQASDTATAPPGDTVSTRVPTTTAAPERTFAQVEVADSVAGMPVEIVAIGSGRRLLTLDLVTGSLETRENVSAPFGPATLFAGPDRILLPSWDEDLPSTLITDEGESLSVELGLAWQLRAAPESGVVWRSELNLFGDKVGMVEQIGLDGIPLGVSVELPSAPLTADPAGGLVVAVPGGVFQVTPDGATRVTTGRLVAIGRNQALTHECDEPLRCDYGIVDRATGERSVLVLDPALGAEPHLETTWTPTSGSAFSGDGRAVVVESIDPDRGFRRAIAVIDLVTGVATELAASPDPLPFVWAPDRRVLLYIYGGRLAAFDATTGVSATVAGGLAGVEAFAIRPTATAS